MYVTVGTGEATVRYKVSFKFTHEWQKLRQKVMVPSSNPKNKVGMRSTTAVVDIKCPTTVCAIYDVDAQGKPTQLVVEAKTWTSPKDPHNPVEGMKRSFRRAASHFSKETRGQIWAQFLTTTPKLLKVPDRNREESSAAAS